MPAITRSFNPKGYMISVGGAQAHGFADDDAVTITQQEDDTEETVGVDGEVTVTIQHNYISEIIIKLKQSSTFNQDLQTLYNAQKLAAKAGGGLVTTTFNMLSLNGQDKAIAAQCWFKKQPDTGVSKSAGEREWRLCSSETIINEAGS